MLLFEHTRVVQQSAKVAAWYVFHRKVDMLRVLEGIQETNEPRRLGRGKNVPLDEDVADLSSRTYQNHRSLHSRARQLTSSILNSVLFRIFFKAHTSPESCFRARKTSP
jgi:hypothetical protein